MSDGESNNHDLPDFYKEIEGIVQNMSEEEINHLISLLQKRKNELQHSSILPSGGLTSDSTPNQLVDLLKQKSLHESVLANEKEIRILIYIFRDTLRDTAVHHEIDHKIILHILSKYPKSISNLIKKSNYHGQNEEINQHNADQYEELFVHMDTLLHDFRSIKMRFSVDLGIHHAANGADRISKKDILLFLYKHDLKLKNHCMDNSLSKDEYNLILQKIG